MKEATHESILPSEFPGFKLTKPLEVMVSKEPIDKSSAIYSVKYPLPTEGDKEEFISGQGATPLFALGEFKKEMIGRYEGLKNRSDLTSEEKMQEMYLRILLGQYSE